MPQEAFREILPEFQLVAFEAYQRASHFIERDPLLIGENRDYLKKVLCHRICELIRVGEKDVIRLANGAISKVRQLTDRNERLRAAA